MIIAKEPGLARVRPVFQINVWDIPIEFVLECGGKGDCPIMPHTLFDVTHGFTHTLKKLEVRTVCVAKYNITFLILGPAIGCRRVWHNPYLQV